MWSVTPLGHKVPTNVPLEAASSWEAEGGEQHALLLAFHWALTPPGIFLPRTVGHSQLAPQALDEPDRWGRLQAGRFEGVRPLLQAQHDALTGGER